MDEDGRTQTAAGRFTAIIREAAKNVQLELIARFAFEV